MTYRKTILAITSLLFATNLLAAAQLAKPLAMTHPIVDKNVYLLGFLQSNVDVQKELAGDAMLQSIAAEHQRVFLRATKSCKADGVCMVKALTWTDEEIYATARALREAESKSPALHALITGPLRSSGAYILEAKQDDADILASAWQISIRGINRILETYGEGAAPRYPLIDSLAVDVKSPDYQQWQVGMLQPLATHTSGLFFEPSLTAAINLLEKNHRDEAGRLEPMETGINAAAVAAIRKTDWKRYRYTVIVVPGAGPTDRDVALSPAGHERTRLAAEAYRAGRAPFILVSGGYVHPSQTRFAEAVEMKRVLLDEFHVPESAIISDPHARHTTTNMRNASREMFRYGVPMDRPALVISDAAQAGNIASQSFADRCLREMGMVPYRLVSHDAPTEVEFIPLVDALEIDPIDPLDP